jgi:hypothetical protein
MKTKILLSFALAGGAVSTLIPINAAEGGGSDAGLTGEIVPKIYFFDHFDGVGADRTSYLERYRAQKGWSGDSRSGLYMDMDLRLDYKYGKDGHLTLNRWGEGQYRQGGRAQWDTERLQLSADYNFFRRSTGGIDFLFSPNQVAGGIDPSYYPAGSTNSNSGYVAQFNDDSSRSLYQVSRFAYGLGFMIKPGVLGAKTTIAINYNGYLRYGQRRLSYALGGSDVQKAPIPPLTNFVLQRWRGVAQNVDENMNRLSWNLTASPKDIVNLAYTGAVEGFDNRARDLTQRDIPLAAPFFYNPTADQTRPLGFSPDSTLVSHALRLNKAMGSTNLAAGYNRSTLKQDSFTQPQIRLGYNTGRVSTENAFVNFASNVNPMTCLQGFVNLGQRDNESSYPVAGLINAIATSSQTLGVRTNRIESVGYGLAAVIRPKGLGSTLTVGWKAEDKERDLTYHATEIIPSVSLYRSDTETDEIYAKWSSLNMKGVTLRLTSSYAWADKTGLVTEPSRAFGLKAAVSYTAPSGLLFSGYYGLKDRENDNNTWTDKAVAAPATYTQDISSTVQSAGASFNFQPAKDVNASIGLDWMRMDASVLYYESSRRRFEATTTFALRDLVGSLVDNYLFSAGADYKASDRLKFTGFYNLTRSDGNLASGKVAAELRTVDDTLDNTLHSIVLGANYDLSKTRQLRVAYRYDDYEDSAYPVLSGGIHSVMFAISFKL